MVRSFYSITSLPSLIVNVFNLKYSVPYTLFKGAFIIWAFCPNYLQCLFMRYCK